MQSDNKELYKLTAARTGKSEQIYKDIGTAVFASLYGMLRKPRSIIVKLKGVGRWYLRKNRMELLLRVHAVDPNTKHNPDSPEFIKHENKVEVQELFKERLKEYDEFIKLRNETKQRRIAGKESSQDNLS